MPLSIDSFTACISIEGVKAECYSPEVSEDGRTASCWIASESGKKFSIDWQDSICTSASNGRVTIDGTPCGGFIIKRKSPPRPGFASRKGHYTSANSVEPFTFSAIDVTDDEFSGLSRTQAERIGEIKLEIYRAEVVASRIGFHGTTGRGGIEGSIYERTKKAGVHKMSYGEEERIPKAGFSRTRLFEILATFIFRYTSLDILRAKGTAPHAALGPSQRPHEGDAVLEILSDNAVHALQNTKKRKAAVSVKAEVDEKRIKRDPDTSGASGVPEVIDLTPE